MSVRTRLAPVALGLLLAATWTTPAVSDPGDPWSGTFSSRVERTSFASDGWSASETIDISGRVTADPDDPYGQLLELTVTRYDIENRGADGWSCRQSLASPSTFIRPAYVLEDDRGMFVAIQDDGALMDLDWAEDDCGQDSSVGLLLARCVFDGDVAYDHPGSLSVSEPEHGDIVTGPIVDSCAWQNGDYSGAVKVSTSVDLRRGDADPIATTTTASLPNKSVRAGRRAKVVVVVSAGGSDVTGSVSVLEGRRELGSASLVNGRADIKLPVLSKGKHRLVAAYAGGDGVAPSRSAVVTLTVTKS